MNMSLSAMTSWLSAQSVALAILLFLSFSAQAGEAVGKLQFVTGEVKAISSDGTIRALKKGDRLFTGDTIKSGAGGTAQVIMRDRSRLLVRTGTAFKIKEFHFDSKKPGDTRSVIALQHGAIRSVSNPSGKGKAGKQFIETPLATVGAAIGDREVIHVKPDATGSPTVESLPVGTFSKIYAGEAVVESPQGKLKMSLQQVGHVGGDLDRTKKPVIIGALPNPIEKRITSGAGQSKMMPAANKGSGGMTVPGPIDVTKTPSPAGPIPIPYPDVGDAGGMQKSNKTNAKKVVLTPGIKIPSAGEPGVSSGMISSKNMGKVTLKKHSSKVKVEGKPVIKLLPTTGQNGKSAGMHVTPSQTKIKVAP